MRPQNIMATAMSSERPSAPVDTAERLIERFALEPHPEGGYYREVYRGRLSLRHPEIPPGEPAERATGTLIYYLLLEGQFSAFHRVRGSDEIWHLYAGGPLELHTIDAEGRHTLTLLCADFAHGDPAGIVPPGDWQAARPVAGARFAFLGCTVSPGFDFADFEMPPREALLARYPAHAALIRALTRL